MSSIYLKFKKYFPSMFYLFSRRHNVLSAFFAVTLIFVSISAGFAQENNDENIQNAIKLFNQGQDAHEKNDFQTALKFYDEAIKLFPEFPEAEFQRGNATQSLGNLNEAEKSFRRALELREDWSLPMTSLGALLVEKGEFTEAETLLTKAIAQDGANFLAYSALADLRLRTQADAEVLTQLLYKLKILTTQARATASIWASRAALENALGNRADAKTSLNRALTIDPNNRNALIERAEIALTEGDNTGAMQIAENLLKIAPNSLAVKLLFARTLAANGKSADALKYLDEIPNPSKDVTDLKNKIGATDAESVADLEKQLEKDAKNAPVLGRLCSLLRVENPLKALDYCKRAYEIEPNNLNHAVGFGAALVQAKQFENAVTLLRDIIRSAPENATAHANLATALFQLKRYREAIVELNWLTAKQPERAFTYYFLAISYDSLEEYPNALVNYQQCLKLADAEKDKLEIDKVNLRLPGLQKLVKSKK
ncbi:hypothetical protein BH10ACI1_BH10ACI1_29940 [soil metagenome]